jgi:hypothetical protein
LHKECLQPIEAFVPESFVPGRPPSDLAQRPSIKCERVFPARAGAPHQPGALADLYVLGHRGERHVERLGDVAYTSRPAAEPLENRAPRRIRNREAQRCALLQRRTSRRLGENDAWLVATAESIDADVVAADRASFERLGKRYLRFR